MRALGIDVGGTFTDAVLVSDGEVRTAKVPTRGAPGGVGARGCARRWAPTSVDRFTHGTTIATNALLERRGARTAFVTTDGFEHLLHLRRQTRAHLYRPCAEHPAAARPAGALRRRSRSHRAGRRARAARPGDASGARRGGDRRLPALRVPGLEARERGRRGASTPLSRRTRGRLPRGRAGVPRVRACLDDGGRRVPRARCSRDTSAPSPWPARARTSPPRWSCAPPAAWPRSRKPPSMRPSRCSRARRRGSSGPPGSRRSRGSRTRSRSTWAGRRRTSARSSDGEARREHERSVAGFPVRLPTLAVHTVGAGGGSIVWHDSGGALRVGPESAGVRPGTCLLRTWRRAGRR